jgi:hypothetical protein
MDFAFAFDAGKVTEVVNELANFILQYAIALAAISALAMALIEAFKSLWKAREKYHMRRLHQWIEQTPIPAPDVKGQGSGATVEDHQFREIVFRQLMHLTTGVAIADDSLKSLQDINGKKFVPSPANALFTLELEKMMGQIQDAADVVLSSPSVHHELFRFLTAGALRRDIDTWVRASEEPMAKQSEKEKKEAVEAYGRLNKYVRRRLDGVQLTASYTWAKKNQWWSVAVGAVLMAISLSYLELLKPSGGANLAAFLQIVVASLLGGILAPIAKDLVTALKKVRTGG